MAREAKVAIVGGRQPLVNEALSWVLIENRIDVLGCFGTADDLQRALASGADPPEVVLVDADDEAAGAGAVSSLARVLPALKLVLLCEVASRAIVDCVLSEPIAGVVLKSDSPQEMILALRNVLVGRSVMPASWDRASLRRGADRQAGELLSAREREVLDLVASGCTNRQIAERLVISTNTVKFHLREIYSRLGVRNRVQAARVAAARRGERD